MIKIKDIIVSMTAPHLKEMGWLLPLENGKFDLKFYGPNGWTSVISNEVLHTSQDLTAQQKEQILENIGINEIINNTLLKVSQSLTVKEKTQVKKNLDLTNVGYLKEETTPIFNESAVLKQLTDTEGNPVYPVTSESAVVLADGNTLNTVLSNILSRLTALETPDTP